MDVMTKAAAEKKYQERKKIEELNRKGGAKCYVFSLQSLRLSSYQGSLFSSFCIQCRLSNTIRPSVSPLNSLN